ncbi:MAG: ABC transporter permease [Pirellula sp.]
MFSLVLRTLVYFRSLLIPVAIGVAIASAVIVGALVVGDSMRGSLRHIAMDRIGRVDSVLIAPRWFDETLVQNLVQGDTTVKHVHGLILVQQGVAERESMRANEMALFGVDESFWSLGTSAPRMALGDEEIAINTALADKLQAKIGDQITLRVASQAVVPADSPLGRRDQDNIVLPRWKVVDILPDRSIARFSLRSDQRPIMNAFANKTFLQKGLEISGKINAVLIASSNPTIASSNPSIAVPNRPSLLERLAPTLQDLGLKWEHVSRIFPDTDLDQSDSGDVQPRVIYDYHQLTTDQLLIVKPLAKPILERTRTHNPLPILTYLANGTQVITPGKSSKRNVPYSTVSAVEWDTVAEMLAAGDPTASQSIAAPAVQNWTVINRWLADEIGAEVGDTVRIEYYLPETVDGEETETSAELVVAAIAPLIEPIEQSQARRGKPRFKYGVPPTPFNDSSWTPVVPGITDKESISKWDAPFKKLRKTEPSDDDYWDVHHLTPKLFVSEKTGTKLFGSRFGEATSIRFNKLDDQRAQALSENITAIARREMSNLGWREIPLREQQQKAASGTTPFDALFMSLSFFVIVAGLLLVALLFRLAIDQRANHWGLLMAAGWTRGSVRRLLLLEGSVVALIGAGLGVLLGLGYAYAMIAGLRSWWIGAITVSFLEYHAENRSLILGWLLGSVAAIGTILLSTSRLKRIPIAKLLKKQMENGPSLGKQSSRWFWTALGACILAIVVLLVGQFLQGQAQAGAFVGAGMLFLAAGLIWVYSRLKMIHQSTHANQISTALIDASSLASSNAKRAPTRSILAIGLVAVASFLILSMSLFQAVPNELGTGRFAFVGKSTQPIYKDLANVAYQREVLGAKRDALNNVEVVPIRVRGGDDASCNNLFQASEPQVLGVDSRIGTVDRNEAGKSSFAWFATTSYDPNATVWPLLETESTGDIESPVPVILDQNTALWALHLGGYAGERFSYKLDGRDVHFKTVGVLQNTILQGSLIIGESNFEKLFPSITGHRIFLFKSKEESAIDANQRATMESMRGLLEEGWSDSGLSLAYSDDILRQLLAVQNTYLGAFQVLGALGLLLGTIGLGISQLRNAMERRGELAAMRAIGFTKARLVWLLTLENGWQLLRGIGIGVGSAALATFPAILSGQPFAGLAWPLVMLFAVVASGLICSVLAAYMAMQWPLLKALRGD